MAKRMAICILLIIAAAAAAMMLANLQGAAVARKNAVPYHTGNDFSERSELSGTQKDAQIYRIGDYQGRVAVFLEGEQIPQTVYDIFVKTLPETDRLQMAEGILIAGEQELRRRIEDYIS